MTTAQRASTAACYLALAAACSTHPARPPDRICQELSSFAESIDAGSTESVLLRGGWGGEMENILMTHDCDFKQAKHGDSLCQYLVNNTSWEFGNYNLTRIAACLDSDTASKALRVAGDTNAPVTQSSTLLGTDSPTVISVTYVPSDSHGLYRLSLSATNGTSN